MIKFSILLGISLFFCCPEVMAQKRANCGSNSKEFNSRPFKTMLVPKEQVESTIRRLPYEEQDDARARMRDGWQLGVIRATVHATAYHQTGNKTSTLVKPEQKLGVAANLNFFPLATFIYIPDVGWRHVNDKGGPAVQGWEIDVFFTCTKESCKCRKFGNKHYKDLVVLFPNRQYCPSDTAVFEKQLPQKTKNMQNSGKTVAVNSTN